VRVRELAAIGSLADRYQVCDHEAGHAVGHHWYGRPVKEIDTNRPRTRSTGWVVPGESAPLTLPPGLEGERALSWIDGAVFRDSLATAVIARMGGLMAGDDWDGVTCSHDRATVARARPTSWDLEHWETLVELRAEEIADDRGYRAAHAVLADGLTDWPALKMPGATAFVIIGENLRN